MSIWAQREGSSSSSSIGTFWVHLHMSLASLIDHGSLLWKPFLLNSFGSTGTVHPIMSKVCSVQCPTCETREIDNSTPPRAIYHQERSLTTGPLHCQSGPHAGTVSPCWCGTQSRCLAHIQPRRIFGKERYQDAPQPIHGTGIESHKKPFNEFIT